MTSPTTQLRHMVLKRAGQAYLAGDTASSAVAAAETTHGLGHNVTLCYWNAADDSPAYIADQDVVLVDAAADRSSWADVAIKAPALAFDSELVAGLATRCHEGGVRLWFDSHAPAFADRTLNLAQSVSETGCDVGIALPARWRRSRDDAERALDAGLAIRFVKGQWPDPEAPSSDARGGYLSLLEVVAGRARFVGLATHDDWLLQEAAAGLAGSGTAFEIQLLRGLSPRRALALAREREISVRFYIPYGHPSLVYSFRTMWENRRHAAWLAQDLLLGSRKGTLLGHHR